MTDTVAVLVNPAAGKGKGGRSAPDIAARLRAHGMDAAMLVGVDADETLAMAREAVANGAKTLVAAGGDGTVHLALQAVADTPTALAVIPVGTGNDNADLLGMPSDVDECVRIIAERTVRALDLGHVTTSDGTSRWFLGVLSSGFDSTVNERANAMTWPSGTARYLIAMVRELRTFRALPYRLTVDGERFEGRGMLLAVGNGSCYGGGMRVCEGAVPDDGVLTCTWLHELGKAEFLRVFPQVYRGTHLSHPKVQQLNGTVIEVDAPGQVVYADGERIGPLPARIESHPGALQVIVPHDSPLG